MNASDIGLPLILLTTYGPQPQQPSYQVPVAYVSAIRRAGGMALLLPPGEPHLERLLDRVDGVILAGGGDINPQRYHGCGHELIYMVDDNRDASEMELVRQVLSRKLPLLAVCRGMQVLNVTLGGTLHPHVPDVYGEQVAHRLPPREPTLHEVELAADSQLAGVMGTQRHATMSWHHQALDRVAPGLTVVARAPDGVVEACEMPGNASCLAVQWHPELTAERDATQQALFDWLIERARGL